MKNGNKLYDALESIIHYDGHDEWLKILRDELKEAKQNRKYSYPIPRDMEWHTEIHTIWMLLVGMFGCWGTSIRGGWIEDFDGCIEFIDNIIKRPTYFEEEE